MRPNAQLVNSLNVYFATAYSVSAHKEELPTPTHVEPPAGSLVPRSGGLVACFRIEMPSTE